MVSLYHFSQFVVLLANSSGKSQLRDPVFLPARRYASAVLCDSDVSVCPDVRHTPVLCLAERKQDREMYTI